MSIVKAADPKRLVRGDVVKIRIEVTAAAGRTWVIVNDPIPPGATIVGNLGGQSDMLADQADGSGWQPRHVDRRKARGRGYIAWMTAGHPNRTRAELGKRASGKVYIWGC